jgi:hypothetical protein
MAITIELPLALGLARFAKSLVNSIGGEAGIRTLGTGFSPYNGLANRRLQPLGHLTAKAKYTVNRYLRGSPRRVLRLRFSNRHLLTLCYVTGHFCQQFIA